MAERSEAEEIFDKTYISDWCKKVEKHESKIRLSRLWLEV